VLYCLSTLRERNKQPVSGRIANKTTRARKRERKVTKNMSQI
jgi:hypothetical protein